MKRLMLILLSFSLLVPAFQSVAATGNTSSTVGTSAALTGVENKPEYLQEIEVKSKESDCFEITSLRESNVKHFYMPDGRCEAIVYSNAVHRKDFDGSWQDIDNRLYECVSNQNSVYITEDERTIFSKKIGSGNTTIFTLNDENYWLSIAFSNENIKNTNAKVSNHAEKYIPTDKDNVAEQYKKMRQIDNTTTVTYKNVLKNVTFEYILSSDCIKENIVLTDRSSEHSFKFQIQLENMEAKLDEIGNINMYDASTGDLIYEIPAPYMYDAAGSISYNVKYYLTKNGMNKYEMVVEADSEWINSSERTFPVVIDPTVRTNTSADTFIYSANADTNYGLSSQLWVSSSRITYIRPYLPTLPSGSIVQSASLHTAYYYYDGVTSGYVDAAAYQATTLWQEYKLTWNTASTLENFGISTNCLSICRLDAANNATASHPVWVSFDITSAVKAWKSGSDNCGIAIKYSSGTNASVIFKSKDAESQFAPYLTIAYSPDSDQVIEDGIYWLSSKAESGSNGDARLMDVTGNSASIGAEIQQWASPDPTIKKYRAQMYKVEYVESGYYRIYTFSNPNYCLRFTESGIVTGDAAAYPAGTLWKIRGNDISGYTITSYAGDNYSIAVPSSTTDGLALTYTERTAVVGNRNRWSFNRFEGFVLSIVASAGGALGHGFLMFENCASSVVELGYINVLPEQTVTIGTAGNVFTDQGSTESEEANDGIFYNREAYKHHNNSYYPIRSSISIPIDIYDLDKINTNYLQNDDYNNWNLIFDDSHNCTWFATQVWNAVSSYSVNARNAIGIHNPDTMDTSIKQYSWYTSDIELPNVGWYGYYDNGVFKYVVGSSGAYPTVPIG